MARTLTIVLFTFVILLQCHLTSAGTIYQVFALRLNQGDALISQQQGANFTYNYNAAAYVDQSSNIELLVRVQDLKPNASTSYDVGPSHISLSSITVAPQTQIVNATQPQIIDLPTNNSTEACGTEDPRIAQDSNGLYHLFYTAYNCTNAMLSQATTHTPEDPTSWNKLGYVFPQYNWSKSASALFKTDQNTLTKNYLFWGDSSIPVGGIGIATSDDGITWEDTQQYLMKTRSNFFDSNLVEGGPAPLQLSTGDFLYIYNSARSGYPSVKPGWDLQYNLGWAILNQSDPTQILSRSMFPILSPETNWEIGNTTGYLTPNVVFMAGLVPHPDGCIFTEEFKDPMPEAPGKQCFIGFYGGADSVIGAANIVVGWYSNDDVEQNIKADEVFLGKE